MTPGNEGVSDYEAKARELATYVVDMDDYHGSPTSPSGPEKIAAALAQSAADERKRCEKLVRAHGVNGCERGMTDPSTGAFECRRADRGDCNCYEFDELADAIAALAEPKGEGNESLIVHAKTRKPPHDPR